MYIYECIQLIIKIQYCQQQQQAIVNSMQALKTILQQRISHILELQQIIRQQERGQAIEHGRKYQLILQHKRAEKNRCNRETQVLALFTHTGNGSGQGGQWGIAELLTHCVDVCEQYDACFGKYRHYVQGNPFQLIKQLFCQFFSTHGFKHKCSIINSMMDKDPDLIPHSLLLVWLSQWSKKTYCKLLQTEIDQSFQQADKNFKPTSYQNSVPVTVPIAVSQNKRKLQSSPQNETNQYTYELSFSNRVHVYSFFIEDLSNYYRVCGFSDLDVGYLKPIKKRIRKEEFLKPLNLSKAVDTLIQTTNNKQISNIIKQYQTQYSIKFPKKKVKASSKFNQNLKKISIPLSPIRKRTRIITQTEQQSPQSPNRSKLLSPKLSQFQFIKPEQIQAKIKRLKFINQKSIRSNMNNNINIISIINSNNNSSNIEFPGIGRKQLSKNDIKQLLSNKSFNFPTSIKNKETPLSVQKRLKNRDFLRCESIQVKAKLVDDLEMHDLFFRANQQSPTRFKNSTSFQLNSQYDDEKLKVSKKFQLSQLKRNIKMAITKKITANQFS